MEKLVISIWKDYGLCINLLWNISYAIKLWLIDTKEGFNEGLVQMWTHYGFNYGDVGRNCVDSGNQGGAFINPWKEWKMSQKHWLGHLCDSFGSFYVCFGSQAFMLRGVANSPMSKGMFPSYFYATFLFIGSVEVSTYFSWIYIFYFVGDSVAWTHGLSVDF